MTPAAITASSHGGAAAFLPDGQSVLTSSIGVAGGTLTTSFNGDDGAGAVLVQPDGKIVAVGFSENDTTSHVFIALARYNG